MTFIIICIVIGLFLFSGLGELLEVLIKIGGFLLLLGIGFGAMIMIFLKLLS